MPPFGFEPGSSFTVHVLSQPVDLPPSYINLASNYVIVLLWCL